jgi:hypothetical protein
LKFLATPFRPAWPSMQLGTTKALRTSCPP